MGESGTVGYRSGAILLAGNSSKAKLFGVAHMVHSDKHPLIGRTDSKIYLEVKKNNQINAIPSNHSPKFAPVINPTLKTGLRAIMTAAVAWLD